MHRHKPVILLDLDGTLLDTAPDLAAALNQVLACLERPALPLADIRPVISSGAAGMLRWALKSAPATSLDLPGLTQQLVAFYQHSSSSRTRLFDGMSQILDAFDQHPLQWGIVTNKRAHLTEPLLQALHLYERPACVISCDSTPDSKPHPEPLLAACRQLNCKPDDCVYIGDAEKDIEAGRRAGMRTLVATYGYLNERDNPADWGANGLLQSPLDILQWLDAGQ